VPPQRNRSPVEPDVAAQREQLSDPYSISAVR
jgi:hypothetical protein